MALIRPFRVITAIFLCVFYIFSSVISISWAETASDDAAITDDPQLQKEIETGREALAQIEEQWELIADPAPLARLSMIVDKLKPHLEREIPYEVRIVRSDVPNAFCLPGGFVFFTSRMLELLHSDSEIAAVMAHEMIHVDQSHSLKMAEKARNINYGGMAASLAAILLSGGAAVPIIMAGVTQVNSNYTIEFEKEADSMGLDVLIAAGYPPTAMVTLMESFMHEEIKQPVIEYGIYMNHPDSDERVQSMSDKLKKLNIVLERKIPLQLLRTSIEEDESKVRLLVDGIEVWSGNKNAQTLEVLEHAQKLLDSDFQMELAPYDLQLEGDGKTQSLLRLKNNVLAKTPLPDGMSDLAAFRGELLAALARAQSKHPIAKYFR